MLFKKYYKVILAVIGALILLGLVWYSNKIHSFEELINMELGELDLSNHPDGYYRGSYEEGVWQCVVEVLVLDGEIVELVFKESIKDKDPTSDIIAKRVVQSQSLDVDTITGATASSKVYLKAIENALNYQAEED